MKKISAIWFTNSHRLIKDKDYSQISIKKDTAGLTINYFTGGTYGMWHTVWYPWHMIREIIYEP